MKKSIVLLRSAGAALAARAEWMNAALSENSAFIWYIYNENEFCTQREPLSVGDTVIVPSAEQAKAPVSAGFGSFYVNEEDFLYWSENPDGSGRRYAPGEALVVDGNAVTLYAVWRERRSRIVNIFARNHTKQRETIGHFVQ